MNYDNQKVMVKMNSLKDNMKLSRYMRRRLKYVGKLKYSGVVALDYVYTSKNLVDNSLRYYYVM